MLQSNSVILLASGGIDSSALIDFYIRRNVMVYCVHYQYGQPSGKSEKSAFEQICKYYKVKHDILDLDFPMDERKEELIFRNLIFILAACSSKPPPLRIALGIHAGTLYYDCTRKFLHDCQRILDGYFSGTVSVEAPFVDFWKKDIIDYCKSNDVPLDLTYSCLVQNHPHCGECTPCRERARFIDGDFHER